MEVTVIRSKKRKNAAIEVRPDLTVVIRAPERMTKREIDRFISKNSDLIEDLVNKMKVRNEEAEESTGPALSGEELLELADRAREYIPETVEYFARLIGVTYGRITIRTQKTRWGSCSGKGNLNFNCLLMLMPPEVVDYVVVHELCHRKEMNHSKAFWYEVEKVIPDYKERRAWLKKNGTAIMMRAGR